MKYLSSDHFPFSSQDEKKQHSSQLKAIIASTLPDNNLFALMGDYQRILADNSHRHEWASIHNKLNTLFLAGKAAPIDGPMVGCPISIRDTDYFKKDAEFFGKSRSIVASIEWMATVWNMTFADTGVWIGKSFEPISKEIVAHKTNHDLLTVASYNPETSRIGRNLFRTPDNPDLLQGAALPSLEKLWNLQPRPSLQHAEIFDTVLTEDNAEKEQQIPYSLTGGIFLANMGNSVLPEMNNKQVYLVNYRWPKLSPVYPMTRLIDELVQIDDGLYLGQLVWASQHYALTTLDAENELQLGETYQPNRKLGFFERLFSRDKQKNKVDYGYQNNGFFVMMDPAYSEKIYADNAFPQLSPRPGEHGYQG